MANVLNKCPICGGELEYGSYWQYTKYYKIGKSGKALNRTKRTSDDGPLEAFFIGCVNGDFLTDCYFTVIVPVDSGIKISQSNDGILYWKPIRIDIDDEEEHA